MQIESANPKTRGTIGQILERFLSKDENWSNDKFGQLFYDACQKFGIKIVSSQELGPNLRDEDLALRDKDRYFVMEPPENNRFLPFVTLHSTDSWVHFSVYVLLAAFDENSEIKYVAFRYETDEGEGDGKHAFCHAQICRRIKRDGKEITPFLVLESDPAIPLEAKNQVSLVLCMLTSIYGRRKVLGSFHPDDKEVWEQMETLRALRRIKEN